MLWRYRFELALLASVLVAALLVVLRGDARIADWLWPPAAATFIATFPLMIQPKGLKLALAFVCFFLVFGCGVYAVAEIGTVSPPFVFWALVAQGGVYVQVLIFLAAHCFWEEWYESFLITKTEL